MNNTVVLITESVRIILILFLSVCVGNRCGVYVYVDVHDYTSACGGLALALIAFTHYFTPYFCKRTSHST